LITLFEEVADDPTPFSTAPERHCDGERDANTSELLD
jgi:uncharacterized protein (DUF1810 family)